MVQGKLSKEDILEKFRRQLEESDLLHEGDTIGTDDSTLKRFLKARDYNIKEATKQFAAAQQWRKTVEGVGMDTLYTRTDPTDFPERDDVFRSWPLYFHKTDKKDRPLNFHYFGKMNLPELYKTCTPERHWEATLVNCEYLTREVLPASTKAAGRTVDTVFVIVDLDGFSLRQFWQVQTLARQCFQVSQDYYPETMGQLAIINAPSTFTYIWGIIKMWLSEVTQSKINILGSDYLPFLETLIEPENIPAALGGKCDCPKGCESSNEGPWKENVDERRQRRQQNQDALATTSEATSELPRAIEDDKSEQTLSEKHEVEDEVVAAKDVSSPNMKVVDTPATVAPEVTAT